MRRLLTLSLVALLLAGCAPPSKPMHPLLIGRWVATGSDGVRQSMVFERGGKGRWTFEPTEGLPEIYEFRFDLDEKAEPFETLDLHGFDRGQLQGKVVYGIISFPAPLTMSFDFEVGYPEQAEELRPEEMGEDARTYRRD